MRLADPHNMKKSVALLTAALCLAPAIGCSKSAPRAVSPPAPPAVQHQTTSRWLPSSVTRFAPLVEQASFRHGVDANLLAIVILVESGGDPIASSPKGAMGLMQLMPATARDIARERGIPHVDARLYDPAYNIDFGAYYLSKQMQRFNNGDPINTVERAAGAYNGGPARMDRHLRTGEALPLETTRYQRWVAGMWMERHFPESPMFGDWYNAGGERLVARSNGPLML
jgi:soluble lytic murein transglycosylase-like protein